MTTIELQDYMHVYSMFSFSDGRKESGILINKYNLQTSCVQYYFIPQEGMQAYKNAFEKYDKDTCNQIAIPVQHDNILSIRAVTLSDYKIIMELLDERRQLLNC